MLALIIAAGCVWLFVSSTASLTEPLPAVLAAVPSPPTLPHTSTPLTPLADSPISPTSPVKLIFIHHSCGENWLADADGGLGIALRDNNYFVSDTNYGWGPPDVDVGYENIGDHTDIGHWYNWFVGPNQITYTTALYTEYVQNSDYSRLSTDPGGENEIIMLKSCYPNSYLDGPTGPPTGDPNPLRGQDAGSGYHTVANAKGIYNDLLTYFATCQDKLFVVITAPPQEQSETDAAHAANARILNDWLVDEWLAGYAHTNVAVFDFFNVLTSNGGDTGTNDLGWSTGNHHRWLTDTVQHTQTVSNDYSAYWGGSGGGSHPTAAGNQKATGEFVLLLNVFYNRWRSGAVPASLTLIAPAGGEHWPVSSTRQIRWSTDPPASVPEVDLYYSADEFVTTRTITSSLVNTGVYTWTTPPTPTQSAQVRVVSVVSPSIRDTSGAFTLYDPATFAHTVYLPLTLRQYGGSSSDGSLIQPADLEYRGAFRLPDVAGLYTATWAYGGSAMTYYPGGDAGGEADGYPGSIFGAGHAQTQYISEISIPLPIVSAGKHVTDLNTAETLQGFHDIKGLVFEQTYWEIPRVGLAYLPKQGNQTTDKLHFCWAMHAPGEDFDTGPTHGWCELDLSSPQPAGAWRIGGYKKYVTADYLFEIPRAWADTYTPGQYLATGRYRDGGQGAEGPSLLAYAAPWNESSPPVSGTLLSATPLLLYGDVYESNPVSMTSYHHSDEWSGGAWLTAGDKSAVIFVGTKGQGDCWYGCADGTVWPEEPPFPPECPERGWWSTGFEGQIIFYDPADLAAVAQGTAATSDPQPYATLNVDPYLYHIESGQQKDHVGAASFDRERGLLYVFEPFADGDKPLVHVWRVGG